MCVTGALGGSRAGLALLEGLDVDVAERAALIERHVRPLPRLAAGRALAPFAHAMMDVSDGLATDAARLALASGASVRIDLDRVPVAPGADVVARRGTARAGLVRGCGGRGLRARLRVAALGAFGARESS